MTKRKDESNKKQIVCLYYRWVKDSHINYIENSWLSSRF